ncbi:EFR1 family ferrodoxin [Candidatus Clostridium helianthi]|uniref:Ferredoxin n=1 Tax=Candidatus Clostridium helianthi TaxID=3381660 RepID=A0ABW8S7W1_9CLOT
MIFYFSATGNCKYVASRIAKVTKEEIVSISDCIKSESYYFTIREGEGIGIISPTYDFGLPTIVCDFFSKLELSSEKNPYVYFIATYGTTCGQTGYMADKYINEKGYSLSARFSVKMPDTWTPTFDLSDSNKVSKINSNAEPIIDEVIKKIKNKELGDFMKNKIPKFLYKVYYPTYEKKRTTDHFQVEDNCVGCGLCEKKCPVKAIQIQNGKPVWVKDKCVLCLGCLHRCPKFSIQYGKKTKNHGQYTNPNVRM